jgi:Zn2+/Cd2+-exporting ATPase
MAPPFDMEAGNVELAVSPPSSPSGLQHESDHGNGSMVATPAVKPKYHARRRAPGELKRKIIPPPFHPLLFCGECSAAGASGDQAFDTNATFEAMTTTTTVKPASPTLSTMPGASNRSRLDLRSQTGAGGGDDDDSDACVSSRFKTTLGVQGVCCATEVPMVRRLLRKLDSVLSIQVNIVTKTIAVVHADPDPSILASVLTSGGFPALVISSVSLSSSPNNHESLERSDYVESTLQLDTTLLLLLNQSPDVLRQASDNVRAWYVTLPSRTLKVEHRQTFSVSQLLETLRECLECSRDEMVVLTDGVKEQLFLPVVETNASASDSNEGTTHTKESWNRLGNVPFSVALSGVFWLVSMVASILHYPTLELTGLISVGCGLPPVAAKAWKAIRHRRVDANVMMVLAAIGAVLLQEWEEAASVAFLFALSEHLEARATLRARAALSHLLQLQPVNGRVVDPKTGQVQLVPASHIGVDSILQVRTGDAIVTDGIVLEGTCVVDESSLTGESRPVSKAPGNAVLGGSLNVGATPVLVKTTRTSPESAVGRLVSLVEQAQSSNHGWTLTLIDGFARAYTPVVLTAALLLATLPWLGGVQLGRYWTYNALILVVIACPCALTIATPVTYAAALAATAQQGIVVKGGGAVLEQLGAVKKIFLDKTGTITMGKFQVTHLEPTSAATSREEMLSLLVALETPSSHPLAGSLLEAARNEGVTSESTSHLKAEGHIVVNGEGVQALVQGKLAYAGNQRMMERLGHWSSLAVEFKDMVREWSSSMGACTVGFVAVQGRGILGLYCLTDQVRPEAAQVLRSLMGQGYEVALLTGDGRNSARAVAEQIGLPPSAVHSQLLPEDKLHLVGSSLERNQRSLFGSSKVMFVGDGINDAPALATADIGVSMGEGAAVAMEMSDVTLMDSNLAKLRDVLDMGQRVRRTVRENIALSLVCKVAVVCLTFMGYMTLLYAIASDVGVMLLVTLNGMKLLPRSNDTNSTLALPLVGERRQRRSGRASYARVASQSSSGVNPDALELV